MSFPLLRRCIKNNHLLGRRRQESFETFLQRFCFKSFKVYTSLCLDFSLARNEVVIRRRVASYRGLLGFHPPPYPPCWCIVTRSAPWYVQQCAQLHQRSAWWGEEVAAAVSAVRPAPPHIHPQQVGGVVRGWFVPLCLRRRIYSQRIRQMTNPPGALSN